MNKDVFPYFLVRFFVCKNILTKILSILFLTVAILFMSEEESCLMLFNFDLAAVNQDFKMAASASNNCSWSPSDCDLKYESDHKVY